MIIFIGIMAVGTVRAKDSSNNYINFDLYSFDNSSNTFVFNSNTGSLRTTYMPSILYCYSTVARSNNNTIMTYNTKNFFAFYYYYENYPSLGNDAGSLAQGDDVLVFPGDFASTEDITFAIYQEETVTTEMGDYTRQSVVFSAVLNNESPYYKEINEENYFEFWYEIPASAYEELLTGGQQYLFNLHYECNDDTFDDDIYATWGGLTPEDIERNEELIAIQEQTQAIQEQTEVLQEQVETSKNIFSRIGEILSYINPLSENFFAYKLIELLINALKSLFIPSDGFFVNWISDLNDYFADRFGMLYYPFSLVIDFLGRVYNIGNNLGNGFVISFPDLKLMDATLIPAFSYDFAVLLQNETFSNIYQIYLICVDVVLILGLLILIKNTFTDVFGGKYIDDTVDDLLGQPRSDAYKRTRAGFYK